MKIFLDKIETSERINALQLKTNFLSDWADQLYYDTDLCKYVVIFPTEGKNAVTGVVLIEPTSVRAAHVSKQSIPTHTPVGTPSSHDTRDGRKKRGSVEKAKSELAKRAEERKAARNNGD